MKISAEASIFIGKILPVDEVSYGRP